MVEQLLCQAAKERWGCKGRAAANRVAAHLDVVNEGVIAHAQGFGTDRGRVTDREDELLPFLSSQKPKSVACVPAQLLGWSMSFFETEWGIYAASISDLAVRAFIILSTSGNL